MKDGKTIAVVPGSFDPITYGHVDVIKRAAELYDTVFVAVMINDQKKYLFTIEERELIARLAVEDVSNVEVISSEGMLWKLTEELCADAIVKGYRNDVDYEYEQKMAELNAKHNPNAKTVLLKAADGLELVSSTAVRKKISQGESIDMLLPPKAAETVKDILSKSS